MDRIKLTFFSVAFGAAYGTSVLADRSIDDTAYIAQSAALHLNAGASEESTGSVQGAWNRVISLYGYDQSPDPTWIAINQKLCLFDEVSGRFSAGEEMTLYAIEHVPHKVGPAYADDMFYYIYQWREMKFQTKAVSRRILATFSNLEALERVGVRFALDHKAARERREREGGPSADESRGRGLTEEELARRNVPAPASRSLWGTWRIALLAVVGLCSLCAVIAWLVRRSDRLGN